MKRKINKKYIPILIVVLFLIAAQGYVSYKKHTINKQFKIVVGKVSGVQKLIKSSPSLFYDYYVGGKLYSGSKKFEGSFSKYKNRFYSVKYSKENSGWSEILLEQPVTDTIIIKKAGFSLPKKKKNRFQEY
ncbi:hypothetical protein [Zobellia roscoffensis]|uniref:hypothetical protein n=1 Tax=Zobellia roscoffensis TaxID=2779508 RepID=UPI00188DA21A|nr:hypothetical protein [Zobellia roscoffensis]